MYTIKLYENGQFCTNVGAPLHTLSEALYQMEKIAVNINATALTDYVGCSWLRAGATPCWMLVCDEWDCPIKTVKEQEE